MILRKLHRCVHILHQAWVDHLRKRSKKKKDIIWEVSYTFDWLKQDNDFLVHTPVFSELRWQRNLTKSALWTSVLSLFLAKTDTKDFICLHDNFFSQKAKELVRKTAALGEFWSVWKELVVNVEMTRISGESLCLWPPHTPKALYLEHTFITFPCNSVIYMLESSHSVSFEDCHTSCHLTSSDVSAASFKGKKIERALNWDIMKDVTCITLGYDI